MNGFTVVAQAYLPGERDVSHLSGVSEKTLAIYRDGRIVPFWKFWQIRKIVHALFVAQNEILKDQRYKIKELEARIENTTYN